MLTRQIISRRCLHTSSRLLQEIAKDATQAASATTASSSSSSTTTIETPAQPSSSSLSSTEPLTRTLGSGKKLAPKKQSIVILDAKQSRLIRKTPKYFQSKKPKPQSKSSSTNKQTPEKYPTYTIKSKEPKKQNTQDLNIEEDFKRLSTKLVKPTQDQIFKTIDTIKPEKTEISKKRYQQIETELSRGFMADQLRDYYNSHFPGKGYLGRRVKKLELITSLMRVGWGLKESELIDPTEDLIIQRIFHLTKKQLFLILAQNVIPNWVRANVKISIIPEDTSIVVNATRGHIQYIEISLERLLKNVEADEIDLCIVEALLQKSNDTLPLEEIQKLSGVYFEISSSNSATDTTFRMIHNYTMFSLGKKRFQTALRLIVWSLNYNQHFINTSIHIDPEQGRVEFFPVSMPDSSIPWNERAKKWLQLKQPKIRDASTGLIPDSEPIKVENINLKKLHSEINSISANPDQSQLGVTLVQFGNLLYDSVNRSKSILNTEIPYAHKQLLSLPLDLPVDETPQPDIDYHSYHIQMKFVPSPFQSNINKDPTTYPPLEFWFELDEFEKADKSSLQAFLALSEQHSVVSLPSKPSDLRFIKSITQPLTKPLSETSEDQWLNDQPGIREFLSEARLDYRRPQGISIPDTLTINLPGEDKPVVYNYVSMSYRTHLGLKFKDRSLQWCVVEGGVLGGRTTEIMMIGETQGDLNDVEFANFFNDSLEFVEGLKK